MFQVALEAPIWSPCSLNRQLEIPDPYIQQFHGVECRTERTLTGNPRQHPLGLNLGSKI